MATKLKYVMSYHSLFRRALQTALSRQRVVWRLVLSLLPVLPLAAVPEPLALRVADTNLPGVAVARLASEVVLPGERDLFLFAPDTNAWLEAGSLTGEVVWPADAPAAQLLLFIKERDGHWFQKLHQQSVTGGTNRWSFDLSATADGWQPVGHQMAWHYRVLLKPQFVGLRLFSKAAYTGVCEVAGWQLQAPERPDEAPPVIFNARPNSVSLPCNGLFEVRFDLPDRYANPFDPAEVAAGMTLVTPSGETNRIDAFYLQEFYRMVDEVGEVVVPEGRPGWCVRYAPRMPGSYRYRLTVTDRHGTAETQEATFEARAARLPGYVRRSATDWRTFETDDGSFFYPIGHNIRSPFDRRMDEQFPWHFRHPPGSSIYRDYFAKMGAARQNFVEIWMCQWSLGLEWSTISPGYHGLGDYHLGNAWELDRVLEWARQSRLRVNLVLNNHGRAGLRDDAEWRDSPFTKEWGGFLPADEPMLYFTDPRAIELQQQLFRYIVARWGWDSTIFAWELWSELDLVGKWNQKPVPQRDPEVIAWHRLMGDYLREIDLNRHLIATHLSGDYRITGPELAGLPQLDHCCIDAYHGSRDPLQIVNLVHETAEHYKAYQKPVLITEFGGSAMGAGLSHLQRELHAALWSATATPLAGTPLFWWWQVIEEQNLYPMYTAVARYMEQVDRRDPELQPVRMLLAFNEHTPVAPTEVDHLASASPAQALVWVFIRPCFSQPDGPLEKPLENLTLTWQGCSNALYRAAFHETTRGTILLQQERRAANQRVTFSIPPIDRDVAVRIKLIAEPAAGGSGDDI